MTFRQHTDGLGPFHQVDRTNPQHPNRRVTMFYRRLGNYSYVAKVTEQTSGLELETRTPQTMRAAERWCRAAADAAMEAAAQYEEVRTACRAEKGGQLAEQQRERELLTTRHTREQQILVTQHNNTLMKLRAEIAKTIE